MPDCSSGTEPNENNRKIMVWERHRQVSYRRPAAGIIAGVGVVIAFGLAEYWGWIAMPDTWWMDVVKAVLGIVIGGLSVVALGTGTIRDTLTAKPPDADKPTSTDKPPSPPSEEAARTDRQETPTDGDDKPTSTFWLPTYESEGGVRSG